MKPTKDLYPGPLQEPDFLEDSSSGELDPSSVRSRSTKLAIGATLVAASLYLAIPLASASQQVRVPVSVAEGTHIVPEIAEWKRWLQSLTETDLHPGILSRLQVAFLELIEPTGLLPGGMATPSGDYLLTWDFEEHHLELELFQDHWEWFYKNRKTGRLAGEEDLVTSDFGRFRRELAKYAP